MNELLWYIHKMEYNLAIERNNTDMYYNMDESYVKSKKPVTKDYHILYDSTYFKCLK